MGLTGIATGEIGDKAQEPAVDPKRAIRKKTITCVECGQTFKTITKRHLESHGLTPAEYKEKWGYPKHQPLSCRETAKARSERMKTCSFGRRQAKARRLRPGNPKPSRSHYQDRRGPSARMGLSSFNESSKRHHRRGPMRPRRYETDKPYGFSTRSSYKPHERSKR